MLNLTQPLQFLERRDFEKLHHASLDILSKTGMKIMVPEFLDILDKKGAKVDHKAQVVRFPPRLIEETIQLVQKQSHDAGRLPFSWHDNFSLSNRPANVEVSFGGSCVFYYDHERGAIREATADDMLRMLQLGDALAEVRSVGNPLMYLREPNGEVVPPDLVAVKGAALIAKNCRRPATAQVFNVRDLEFIIEIGIVVKGSWAEYKKEPFLMSVKEPTSPLQLTSIDGAVILEMAKRGLPCFIVPMPLMGLSAPITPAASIAIANAEILGIWTAVKACNPEAPVQAQVVSGVMDMRLGRAVFAAPEAILIDAGMAQLYRDYYQLTCETGASWIDAKYPGMQAGLERAFKFVSSALCGKICYPAGALAGNMVFSPEQALIDIDLSRALNRFLAGMEVNDETLCLDLIHEVGIGGHFFDAEHTAANFKKMLWLPELFDKTSATSGMINRDRDIVNIAHAKWRDILKNTEPYRIEIDKAKAIDDIVRKAEKSIIKSTR